MKKKILFFTIILLGFVLFLIIKFLILNSENNYGELKITSSPSTSIFLNSKAAGETKLGYKDKIKEGEYLIKLIPEGSATDTASWSDKIKIVKNTMTYINAELGKSALTSANTILSLKKIDRPKNNYGEIEVESEPAGAIIYLDNDEKGISPMIMTDVPNGEHELAVFSPGFIKRSEKINVESEYRIYAKFKLAVDENQKTIDDIKKLTDEKKASNEAEVKKYFAIISDTPIGFLRVRDEPTINASETARVQPKDKFEILEEKTGWYKIMFEKDKYGWISAQYAEKKDQ